MITLPKAYQDSKTTLTKQIERVFQRTWHAPSVINTNLTLLEAYMSTYTSIRSLLGMASASSDEERMGVMMKKTSKVEKWFVQVRNIVTMRSASEDVEENLHQYDRMMLASLRFIYKFAEDGMEGNMQKVYNQFKRRWMD